MKNKKISIITAILVAVTLTAFSCGKEKEKETSEEPVNNKIQFTVIGQGDNIYSGDNGLSEQYLIIKNNADWQNLITAMDATNYNPISPTFTEINIDFSQFSIIAVIDSVYGNAGHTIYVKDITENSENLVVEVEKLDKGNVASVMTQPFQIVKIPATNKEIVFIKLKKNNEQETPEEPVNNTNLQGTKWKLEGIVNEQTGEMRVLAPVDCERCYTLEFNTNTTGTGKTTTNQMGINLNQSPFIHTLTEMGEITGDGNFFVNILYFIRSYECKGNSLKFFYQYENNNCFLFYKKLVQ